MNNKTITNHETGRKFTVRLVNKGDHYGRNMKLIHDKTDPLVEFYDRNHLHEKSPNGEDLGQFVSRYYLSTLTGQVRFGKNIFDGETGLNLDAGIDAWKIDARGIEEARQGLVEMGAIPDTIQDGSPIDADDGPS